MTFATWSTSIVSIIDTVVLPLLFGAAFVAFVWGVVQYFFLQGDSEEGRTTGRSFVVWGILGMVLLFSVWGVINLILGTLGFSNPT